MSSRRELHYLYQGKPNYRPRSKHPIPVNDLAAVPALIEALAATVMKVEATPAKPEPKPRTRRTGAKAGWWAMSGIRWLLWELNLGRPSGKSFLRYSRNDVLENRGLWARGP